MIEELTRTRTVEITTTGHRSGRPVRIEIWWFHFEGRFVLTGVPGPRDWVANLRAAPSLVVHAAGRDVRATAQPVVDRDFRRRFFAQRDAEVSWYRGQAELADLIDNAPMVELTLEE